jgi:4-hydroxyacetophenone monooxygenase
MSFIAGERVPDDYVPICSRNSRSTVSIRASRAGTSPCPKPCANGFVLVIGAGMSGLLQGLRLKQAGIPFTIVEKNDSVGGTW